MHEWILRGRGVLQKCVPRGLRVVRVGGQSRRVHGYASGTKTRACQGLQRCLGNDMWTRWHLQRQR